MLVPTSKKGKPPRGMSHPRVTIGLSMKGKLNKEDELPTSSCLRGAMHRFYNAWERHYNLEIPLDVKQLIAPVSGRIVYIDCKSNEKPYLKSYSSENMAIAV